MCVHIGEAQAFIKALTADLQAESPKRFGGFIGTSKPGEADFRANQAALCKVLLEHPRVICYHASYPSKRISQRTEIYPTDEAFAAHPAFGHPL